MALWYSLSVSIDVVVSSKMNKFDADLFILLWILPILPLSPKEQMFQDVNLISSSGDFEG